MLSPQLNVGSVFFRKDSSLSVADKASRLHGHEVVSGQAYPVSDKQEFRHFAGAVVWPDFRALVQLLDPVDYLHPSNHN